MQNEPGAIYVSSLKATYRNEDLNADLQTARERYNVARMERDRIFAEGKKDSERLLEAETHLEELDKMVQQMEGKLERWAEKSKAKPKPNENTASETNSTKVGTSSTEDSNLEHAAEATSSESLLLQAKSTSSESYVTIKIGDTHFLDDGKCAVILKTQFFTDKPHRDRLKYLKLEYTFSREGGKAPNIVEYRPIRAVGRDTPVTVEQEVQLTLIEPHTGSNSNAKQNKQFVQNERMEIRAQDFRTKVTWVLSENPADKKGVPCSFQGVVILDSITPFTLGIKVFADIPGSIKDWFIFSKEGAGGKFYIDPETWKAVAPTYKKVVDFQSWDGSIPGACVRWSEIE